MSNKITRRDLLLKSIASFGALSVPVLLTACGDDQKNNPQRQISADFLHGVASGDPLQDRVILWTRITPKNRSARLQLRWEIATDATFSKIANSGTVQTARAQDFTIKVDADKLIPNQNYFYRFIYGDKISAVGRTKTLPVHTQSVKLAVCSCANYPAGYFHVYREMAKQDVNAIIHLGDYIYEYGQGGYATEDAARLGRTFAADNQQELIKLDDYRKRYALYRTDVDLQAAHLRHPFIVIWDDHELANDAWKDGAENHQANKGAFEARKLAALQAYFEWMPIRPVAANQYFNIYRQFDFGQLVQLTMLDTRILARDKQLSYSDYIGPQGFDIKRFQTDLFRPTRTILGYTQREWLQNKLGQSKTSWNVIGQQVLMAKMLIPAELLPLMVSLRAGQIDQTKIKQLTDQVTELVALKLRSRLGAALSAIEQARLDSVVPYNLDAWDGYAAEREMIYQSLKTYNKKAVVLAGDTHNAWSAKLTSQQKDEVAVELACSSVSSPGLEKYLKVPQADIEKIEYAFTNLIDGLTYSNLNQRGYLLLNFSEQALEADWIFIDSVQNKTYIVDQLRQKKKKFDLQLNDASD
ncbi:alkaline phosphatase D [Acinetobacter calcoaceticus]|uniref:Alkaline phosphatase D n=1 Tax=Acinetobacter calcoaceticus TaxID=471 RepID=A0A4R1Y2U8_ACICA|nr:alkaline phosphatase D [Acinetobacter calcoaceticus]